MLRPFGLVFPRRLTLALLTLTCALVFDLLTTYMALASGRAIEANPLAAHFLALSGFGSLTLIKLLSVIVAFAMAVFALRSRSRGLLRFYVGALFTFSAFFLLVGLSNLSLAFHHLDFFTALTHL